MKVISEMELWDYREYLGTEKEINFFEIQNIVKEFKKWSRKNMAEAYGKRRYRTLV